MAGRKTKLTPELIAQAEKLLRAGNYVCVVADYLGISEQTWYDWIKKGENGRGGLYLEFTEAIKRAMPVAEIGAVAGILQAAKDGNWQAFAWFLERKFSDRWGRKEIIKQELTGKGGGPVELGTPRVDLSALSDEELETYAALSAKARGEPASIA